MTYSNLINHLLSQFPELTVYYSEEKDYVEDLPYLVLEIIFVPYLKKVIQENDKSNINKVANFLEDLYRSGDTQVQALASVSVLESIMPERDLITKARKHFGPKTKEELNSLETY